MKASKLWLGLLVAVLVLGGVAGLFWSQTSAEQTRVIHLAQGWNLVTWTGETQSASAALAPLGDAVSIVYGYANESQSFTRCIVGRPEVSTLTDFQPEEAYWVLATQSADWSVPGQPSCPPSTACPTSTPCPDCGEWQSAALQCAADYGECVDSYGECGDLYGECVDDYGECVDDYGNCVCWMGCLIDWGNCWADCELDVALCVLGAPNLSAAQMCVTIWDCTYCDDVWDCTYCDY